MQTPNFDHHVDVLHSLHEPVRRALYRYVVACRAAVGRDEAAHAVGISRSLAAYHLDKLVDAGLLEASFARRSGRRGPGAGRPAKLYERSAREVHASLPPRSYELAAELLARAVTADPTGYVRTALEHAARSVGSQLAATDDPAPGHDGRRRQPVGVLRGILAAWGYEPYDDDGTIRLYNCPFQRLSASHRELICEMNLALLQGVADRVDHDAARAVLEPQAEACCVAFLQA